MLANSFCIVSRDSPSDSMNRPSFNPSPLAHLLTCLYIFDRWMKIFFFVELIGETPTSPFYVLLIQFLQGSFAVTKGVTSLHGRSPSVLSDTHLFIFNSISLFCFCIAPKCPCSHQILKYIKLTSRYNEQSRTLFSFNWGPI